MKQIGPLVRMRRLVDSAKEVGNMTDPAQAERRARDLRDVGYRYRRECTDLLTVLRERGYTPFQNILEDAIAVFDRTIDALGKLVK